MNYLAKVTAYSKETGKPRTFIYPLSEAGELLNELVLSGYHNISNMQLVDKVG